MTNSDAYYLIGAGHTHCQDYAYHGYFGDYTYAIVCDGCSGSKNSDIGARLFAHSFAKAAEFALYSCKHPDKDVPAILSETLWAKVTMLEFAPDSLFSTVVAIVYDQKKDILYSFAWGDGKIVYKYKTGNGYLTDINYASNAPFYLAYRANNGEAAYESNFGKAYANIQGYMLRDGAAIEIPETLLKGAKLHYEVYPNAARDLSFASVFSDGIDTFHKKDDANIVMPKHEVFSNLTGYKGFQGEFVQRRMLAFKKQFTKDGWQHFDDIACGTISFV